MLCCLIKGSLWHLWQMCLFANFLRFKGGDWYPVQWELQGVRQAEQQTMWFKGQCSVHFHCSHCNKDTQSCFNLNLFYIIRILILIQTVSLIFNQSVICHEGSTWWCALFISIIFLTFLSPPLCRMRLLNCIKRPWRQLCNLCCCPVFISMVPPAWALSLSLLMTMTQCRVH